MLGKSKEKLLKRRLGEGWMGSGRGWPGGMCGGRILRFAEAESDFGICSFGSVLSTRLQQGLAVFNRYAHSAGPG